MEANALSGADVISLPAGTINLTVGPAGTATAATGDLDVTGPLEIAGAGAAATVIDASAIADRAFDGAPAIPLKLSGMTIRHGKASNGGDVQALGPLTLSGVDLQSGDASDGGGVYAGDTLTATDSAFHDAVHTGGADGEGIYAIGALSLTRVSVTGNTVHGQADGAGVYASADAALTDVTISGNHADSLADGTGLYVSGKATLTRVNISGNTVGGDTDGGGAYLSDVATLRDVAVTNNAIPSGDGGGLYLSSGGTLLNVTVTGNASGAGPGAGIWTSSPIELTHVTVAGNTGGQGAAIFGGSSYTVRNSIVAAATPACDAAVHSAGANIGSDATCGFSGPGDRQSTDPLLGPATADGATIVLPLLDGSPALDAADSAGCPAADQRGLARPQGARCDIGAYERAVPAPPVPVVPAASPPPLPRAKVLPLKASQVITLPSARACVSRRSFRIHLHHPAGVTLASATVFVNGHRVRVVKGRRLSASVDLKGLPKGRFSVKIAVVTTTGVKLSSTRRYRTCTPKKKHR